MDLNKMFGELKKKKWIWIVYISLTIPIDLALALTVNCLAFILMALVTMLIPYVFGVRSAKTFLKAGVVILLITGILYGALYTHFMFNEMFFPYFTDRTLDDTQLVNGTVTPYLGNETTLFNYTVTYEGEESAANITVYANITDAFGRAIKSIPLMNADGKYYNETTLGKDVYSFHFSVYSNSTGFWNTTDVNKPGFGPVTIPYTEMLMQQLYFAILTLFLYAGTFFLMFVGFFHLRKKGKEDKMKWAEEQKTGDETKAKKKEDTTKEEDEEEEEEKEEDEFTCTSCNATVKSDANFCPKCGEEFEGEEEEAEEEKDEEEEGKGEGKEEIKEEAKAEFTCTSCGVDVGGDATVCPNCGEEFEGIEEKEDVKEEIKEEFTCTSCGADVAGDATVCPKCGEPFEDDDEEESSD